MPAATPVIVHASPKMSIATFRDVVLVSVHEAMTVEGLRASVEANRTLCQRFPQGVGALTFAEMNVKLPSAELRAQAAEAIAAVRGQVRCAAQVLVGGGFMASAVRSVITAIEMLRPDQYPRRTFSDFEMAAAWMAEHMGHDLAWESTLLQAARSLLREGPALAQGSPG